MDPCRRLVHHARFSGRSSPLHATMLGFITSDAAIASPIVKKALREAVALTFNRITIDGDTSNPAALGG